MNRSGTSIQKFKYKAPKGQLWKQPLLWPSDKKKVHGGAYAKQKKKLNSEKIQGRCHQILQQKTVPKTRLRKQVVGPNGPNPGERT